jgi:hypothetical protein
MTKGKEKIMAMVAKWLDTIPDMSCHTKKIWDAIIMFLWGLRNPCKILGKK